MKIITAASIFLILSLLLLEQTTGIPDGIYSMKPGYCKDGHPLSIVEETDQFAIEAAANYLLFDEVQVTFVLKNQDLVMQVQSPECRVNVYQKIKTNSRGVFQIEPHQTTQWIPENCHFKGRVNDKNFIYGKKEALKDHSLGVRDPQLAKHIINQNPEYYPSILAWDRALTYKKTRKGYTFLFSYREIVTTITEKEKDLAIPYPQTGRFLFGCPLNEDGFQLDIVRKN